MCCNLSVSNGEHTNTRQDARTGLFTNKHTHSGLRFAATRFASSNHAHCCMSPFRCAHHLHCPPALDSARECRTRWPRGRSSNNTHPHATKTTQRLWCTIRLSIAPGLPATYRRTTGVLNDKNVLNWLVLDIAFSPIHVY